MAAETPEEAYKRGEDQGKVLARLDGHDEHFKAINGNVARFATESANLAASVQELRADLKGRDVTAATLVAADNKRRLELEDAAKKSEVNWMPWARLFIIITILIQAFNLYVNSQPRQTVETPSGFSTVSSQHIGG